MPTSSPSALPIVLSFAGIDPSGGAGLLAHVQTINRHDCYPMGVATLQTVQNTLGVQEVLPCDPKWVRAQAEVAMTDMPPHAMMVSAVGSLPLAKTLVEMVTQWRSSQGMARPLVIDTLLHSSSGKPLMAPAALPYFYEHLLPLATVITPNALEFQTLLALSGMRIFSPQAHQGEGELEADSVWLEEALLQLASKLGVAIYLKGGHWQGPPIDRLAYQGRVSHYQGPRFFTRHTHGTGCALAAAFTCRLAQGHELPEAAAMAHAYVASAIQSAPGLGNGKGPLNLRSQS